jgi:diguanylate cyclase (GGDEF)-like protein
MPPINRTLQIISIQHELAMNIGLDLKLENMLNTFMQRALHRLSLSSVMMYVFNQKDNSIDTLSSANDFQIHCYPKSENNQQDWLTDQAISYFARQQDSYLHIERQSSQYYFLQVPQFGVLILERRNQPIDEMIMAALLPLLSKLSASCRACQEHQSLIEEIDARKNAEKLLIQQSLLDPLTGLSNRKMFNMNLEAALINSEKSGMLGAIFIIDLDRFKVINDSLGHVIGDEVLRVISQRLLKCIREGDSLARIGGDEFVLLVVGLTPEHTSSMSRAEKVAEKVLTLMAEPIHVEKHVLNISTSIGINLFPVAEDRKLTTEQQSDLLVKNADLAMYKVKHANRNGFCFFSKELQSFSEKRTQIEKQLRTAITENEFEVHYQPLVAVDGQVLGVEALLRWSNLELGHISPVDFIPIAEESGLILEIGAWVIEQVCKFIHSMEVTAQVNAPKYISINVSPRQFVHHNFADNLICILNKYKVDSKRIRVEITEGVAIDNIELTVQKIQRLKEYGVVSMLDDFGSGYSSLSYLHQLPLQTIKIDRSFISNIDTSNNHRVIVDSIIDICEHFSLECVVEGVENSGEFNYLSTKKITAFQGYYFHRPMPEEKLIALLNQHDP